MPGAITGQAHGAVRDQRKSWIAQLRCGVLSIAERPIELPAEPRTGLMHFQRDSTGQGN